MLNQVVCVGRLTKGVELEESENQKYATITVAIPRSYKNEEGIYDTDFITARLWGGVAENTAEYCGKGDLIGIKGRLQSENIEKEDGTKEYKMVLIAEKITFLSSAKK